MTLSTGDNSEWIKNFCANLIEPWKKWNSQQFPVKCTKFTRGCCCHSIPSIPQSCHRGISVEPVTYQIRIDCWSTRLRLLEEIKLSSIRILSECFVKFSVLQSRPAIAWCWSGVRKFSAIPEWVRYRNSCRLLMALVLRLYLEFSPQCIGSSFVGFLNGLCKHNL